MTRVPLMMSLLAGLMLSTSLIADTKIIINNEGLYPEGISYDTKGKHFYISSVAKGEIWKVNAKGESELFAKNPKFASAIGLQVDEQRHRLLVCISDPGVGENSSDSTKGKLASLAIYDLNTKKETGYYNLAPVDDKQGHFANDITIDDKGNSYVTDSFSPIIYKIDTTGKVSILISNPKWQVPQGKFGLNGIVYHPDGFLIVAHYATGKLYKIDLSNPESFKEITIKLASEKWKVTGLDGLLLLDRHTLVAVNNDSSGRENGNFVLRLASNNNWDSASMSGVMSTSNTFPTTLTRMADEVYVLHAKLATLFMGNKIPEKQFEIEKVIFTQ